MATDVVVKILTIVGGRKARKPEESSKDENYQRRNY